MQTFTFRAFRASKLTKAIYALYSHAQLPGAGLLDREGWPEARACRGRALLHPRGGLNTADSAPLWARDGPVRGWSMVRPKACHTAAARYPPHQSGTGPTRAWLGPTPVRRTQHLEAVRLLSSWRRSRPVRLIHRGGRAEGDMRSSAAQPSNALFLSRTPRPWPARVTGRLQCNGHMVWKPEAVSAFDLAQRSRSRTLRVQPEVPSGAMQLVDALPHAKARRVRSVNAMDGLQLEGDSLLSTFCSRAVHADDMPRPPSTPVWQTMMIAEQG